jgi:hypothetical protein
MVPDTEKAYTPSHALYATKKIYGMLLLIAIILTIMILELLYL